MTVCISAHCFKENTLVLASDSMVSTGDMSSETLVKIRGLTRHWITHFAGNDVSVVELIFREVKKNIALAGQETTEAIVNAFIQAIQSQLTSRAENEVLLPLGYTLQEFKASGLAQLGSENFSRLLFQIQQQQLDVQFLISGFDNGAAEIFTVSPPGRVSDYTNVGFWAIGSGQTNALGSLFNQQYAAKFTPLDHCIYRVCEAKFNSESAVGIGKGTNIALLRPDGTRLTVPQKRIDELREIWKKTRVTIPPQEGTDLIHQFVEEAQKRADEKTVRPQEQEPKQLAIPQQSADQQ